MHELSLHSKDKTQRYEELLPQICSLINEESDLIANLANTAAVLKEAFGWFWVGFYLVKQEELVLGPFQGPLACTRIPYNRGVCGQSWAENKRWWCRMSTPTPATSPAPLARNQKLWCR